MTEHGNISVKFGDMMTSVLGVYEEYNDHIEGALAVALPRHGDASQCGIIGWMPARDSDDSLDQEILLAELLTGFVWALTSTFEAHPDAIRAVVEKAIEHAGSVMAHPKSLMTTATGGEN